MTAREQHEAYLAERRREREVKRAKAKAAYEAGKHKYATYEEFIAAARKRQKAYQKARKNGTWRRKRRIFSERIARKAGVPVGYDPKDPSTWGEVPPPIETPRQEPHKGRSKSGKGRMPSQKESREERRRRIKEQYGFDIWTPVKKLTPEELEGRKQWLRDEEAEYRKLHREHIRNYNREYRQRKRAEALAVAQKTWTAEDWAKWRAKEAAKGRGKPEHFVKDVVKLLAESGKISEDEVTNHLLETGGIEFLVAGAEAIGKDRAKKPAMIKAAARAVAFYIDPEGAIMFPGDTARCGLR